jgi:D-glycero-alpha-D-manno-heptose-7-phosphate kinase
MPTPGNRLRALLARRPITGSAPCRVDSGGTWDIKALALPFEHIKPVTVNLALNMRTCVTLLPFEPDWVKVSSDNFDAQEAYPFGEIPFDSQFGLIFSVLSFFQLRGLEVRVRSASPVKAGLGGSSAAAVAVIKACSIAKRLLNEKGIAKGDILHLAYHLEDAVNMGMCGLQDQGASVYGGVNKWTWGYSRKGRPYERESLLNEEGQRELSKRMLVVHSGGTHVSARINRSWIQEFLEGKTRSRWIEVNGIVNRLARHLKEREWEGGAKALRDEVAIRKEITPQALTSIIGRLIQEAEGTGCGARFAGAGGGGAVWALGEIDAIHRLRQRWAHILEGTGEGRIMECAIDPVGVREERKHDRELGSQ